MIKFGIKYGFTRDSSDRCVERVSLELSEVLIGVYV